MANGKDNLLKEARSLLSSIQKQGQDAIFQDSTQTAEALRCSITLIESFHRSVQAGQGPFPSSPDWKIVNAVLELLVRLGICPYLSPGVGVAREKLSGNADVLAAASAISDHLSGFPASDSLRSHNIDTLSTPASHILCVSVEVLASLVWDKSANINGSTEVVHTAMSSLGDLVVHSFLWDMMAAYLQLACCPQAAQSSDDGVFKQIACERIKVIVEELPVRQVVEACFILLHRSSPGPPDWLKSEAGKQLSKLVMRRGGVAVVLEELVGRATKGNVEIYDKVAAHLAKTPKSIATVDDYFKAICPQLLPLLLPSQLKDPKEGETSRATLINIHITAVSLVCKLFSLEPGLADEYLLQPLLRPLLSWSSVQRGMKLADQDLTGAGCKKEMDSKHSEGDILLVTENELVDTFVQISVLLTAGHRAFLLFKEIILLKTKDIAPLLLKVHSQLEAADGLSNSWTAGSFHLKGEKNSQYKGVVGKDEGKPALRIVGKGIAKGFLETGLGVEGAIEETTDQQNSLTRLRFALADLVMVIVNQPLQVALPIVSSILFHPELSVPRWPGEQGEIWDSLSSKTAQPGNSAMYLSRLLLAIENWPLAVALMDELMQKVLDLRQSMIAVQNPGAIDLLGYMQDFEILNNEVGSKALEQFPRGAASLVKGLLENKNIVQDEDLLELVLHMINSVLKGFHSCKEADGYVQNSSSDQKDSVVLTDMALALERVCNNACLSEKLRQMSFTLAEECSLMCNNPQSE